MTSFEMDVEKVIFFEFIEKFPLAYKRSMCKNYK